MSIPIVFVPGFTGKDLTIILDGTFHLFTFSPYYEKSPFLPSGSYLFDSNNNRRWIGPLQALGFSQTNIALPLWTEEKQPMDDITPREVISSVGPVGIYRSFLGMVQSTGRPFYPFPYDWRRDANETLEALKNFITEVHEKHAEPVQIVAHSFGSLLAIGAVNELPSEAINSVLLGAPCFGGSFEPLGWMTEGCEPVQNISKEQMFTFPLVYSLLPLLETEESVGPLYDESGHPLETKARDVAEWETLNIGPFSFCKVTDEIRTHINKCLNAGKQFRERFQMKEHVRYPPIALVVNKSVPTKVFFL